MKKHTAARRLLTLSFCSVAFGLSGSTSATPAEGLDEILDKARRAAGWEQGKADEVLRLTGEVTYLGVEETVVAEYARDGRFRIAFEGQLTREVRYDGQSVRLAEFSPLWHELEFFGREVELLRAWVYSGYWLDPSAPLVIERAQKQAGEGLIGLDLLLEDGLLQARVELDAEDHLVRSLSFLTGNGELRTEYADHAAVQGRQVARAVSCQMSLGAEYSLQSLEASFEKLDESLFNSRPDVPDFRFDPSVGPEIEVVRSKSKHLWVRALVNGEDLGLFLFDTGAGFSGISAEAADKLGLSAFGRTSLTGLGGGVTTMQMRRAKTLQIGPLIIDNLVLSEMSVARKEQMVGEKVAGALGWDVMRRAIVDLEPRGNLLLYDPSTFELSEGSWVPMHLHYKVPYVRGRFPGDNEGLFMLDCGAAGSTVMFFHHAAKALGFLDGAAKPSTTGHGAGGTFHHRLDHIDWFEMGEEHLDDFTIILSTAPDGEADPYSLGLIGGGLLRLYRLIFDYQNKRVVFIEI